MSWIIFYKHLLVHSSTIMAPKRMEFPIIHVSQQYSPTLDYLVGEETEGAIHFSTHSKLTTPHTNKYTHINICVHNTSTFGFLRVSAHFHGCWDKMTIKRKSRGLLFEHNQQQSSR